jgi:Na+/H+-dicarboxylate symporter
MNEDISIWHKSYDELSAADLVKVTAATAIISYLTVISIPVVISGIVGGVSEIKARRKMKKAIKELETSLTKVQ